MFNSGEKQYFLTLVSLIFAQNNKVEFTYYGHACFSITVNGKTLLFDPFITPNELAKNIDINTVKADYILISHGHEDHVADALAIAKNTGAKLISNFEIVNWFANQGISNNHPMNTGGQFSFDFGTVKCTNAIHSSVLPDGTYGGNPMGFIIKTAEKTIYYAGDTALTIDMQLLPQSNGKIDIAILPIGDNFTMGIDDAVLAADFVKCNEVIGVHFDTFGWIKINHAAAMNAFANKGKNLHLLNIGETRKF